MIQSKRRSIMIIFAIRIIPYLPTTSSILASESFLSAFNLAPVAFECCVRSKADLSAQPTHSTHPWKVLWSYLKALLLSYLNSHNIIQQLRFLQATVSIAKNKF